MSSDEESFTATSGSGGAVSTGWWEKKDMLWKLKERMQKTDDLGAEISHMLVESLLAVFGSRNLRMMERFGGFLWFFWSPKGSGDRIMTRKVSAFSRIGASFSLEMMKRKKKKKKGSDDKLSVTPLTLSEEEFQELLNGFNGGFHKIQWLLALLKEIMADTNEDSLEKMDCRIRECKNFLEEFKPKIEGLKRASPLFSEFGSEIEEFRKGEVEEEMGRQWNTSWELEEEEAVAEYIVWSPRPVSC